MSNEKLIAFFLLMEYDVTQWEEWVI